MKTKMSTICIKRQQKQTSTKQQTMQMYYKTHTQQNGRQRHKTTRRPTNHSSTRKQSNQQQAKQRASDKRQQPTLCPGVDPAPENRGVHTRGGPTITANTVARTLHAKELGGREDMVTPAGVAVPPFQKWFWKGEGRRVVWQPPLLLGLYSSAVRHQAV